MNVKTLPSLEGMERVPIAELSERFDEIFHRVETENVSVVLTQDGKDKYVLAPYSWFDDSELLKIEVDADLLEQVRELTARMGTTPEDIARQFLEWCVNPETTEEAKAWLLKHKDDLT